MNKRIGITQRVVYLEKIDERRDVLDQRWYDFGNKIGIQLIPIPNNLSDIKAYVESLKIEGFIFSGGNNIGISNDNDDKYQTIQEHDVAYERDETERKLVEWAILKEFPVIGVCRGLQFINAFFKGNQNAVNPRIHVAKKHEVFIADNRWQLLYGETVTVNSYHRRGIFIEHLAGDLLATAIYNDREVEGAQHKKHNIQGIMWHPERYNQFKNGDINFFRKKLNIS